MQAIILAAGMGKRLKKLTQNNTKCMVKVNGVSMIERLLSQLDKRNLSKIVIVVGYEAKGLIEYIDSLKINTEIVFIENPIYDKTNNIYSLALAEEYLLKEDTLLFESDLIFEDRVLDLLINDKRKTLALVDKYESWMDGTVVKLDEEDNIIEFIPGKNFVFEDIPEYYKTVNIYKFSKEFCQNKYVPFLKAYEKALGLNEYYEQVLKVITMIENPEIKALRLNGQKWYEIDDIQDLDIASSIFCNEESKLNALNKRYGGYWRYPELLDFCYLVNPYYPPKKLLNEIKANFETIVTQYPSGQNVNSLLASKDFGVDIKNIVVGNGAAELIKDIMARINGKVGFIRPTFEEYPNRYDEKDSVVFYPESNDFSYTADDVINFFGKKENQVDNLVLINPDNPTGNYLEKSEVLKVLNWCSEQKIKLIYDESFIDFADDENGSLIDEEIFLKYENLIIVKSISKSYGVPGLRLGVCVSADTEMIGALKKSVAIWNINSLGEFYLQIAEKYKSDYKASLKKIKKSRENMFENLKNIEGLKVYSSQANYLMVELLGAISSHDLTKELLSKYNILIKDLTPKMNDSERQFVRLAVRTEEENNKLIQAIKNNLKG